MDELIFRSFKGPLSPAEEQALATWRAESPKHEARYRELRALADLTASADAATRVRSAPPVAELVRRASPGAQLGAPPRRISYKLAIAAAVGLAAGAILVAGILTRSQESWSGFTPDQIVTAATETATVTFPDGTVVRLAPDSRLRVTPGRSRDVMLEGRAFFDVAKVGRRFRVRTTAGDAVVLGTRFEVQATERSAQVLVLEGRVALGDGGQRVEVAAGEVSRLVQGTATRPEKVPNASERVSWIGRLLVFRATPVSEALREIERQYGASIDLRDSALAHTTITGWYADKSFEEVMQIVCSVLDRECAIGAARATIDRAQAR